MKKAMMLLPVLALAAGIAQAGAYSVLQESDCPLVSAAELSKAVRNAGAVTGLDLPKDMALRAELHCTVDGKAGRGARYVYTFRAAIERQVSDGEQLRWMPVAANTGFGTTGGSSSMLRQVHFTVRDLVRQEP
ncbi:hypothetical protein ACFPOE_10790 [Caenimonas terrae]|uniref:Uncharacterized protein n=1 Tax=Caenimonas terrae TaxID=696074 RepID=A0ABW0NBH2_9BURK